MNNRVIDRPVGPNIQAQLQVNGWMFFFGKYHRTRHLITSGRCRVSFVETEGIRLIDTKTGQSWLLPVDKKGRFLGTNNQPVTHTGRIVSLYGESGGRQFSVNFWHWVLGLNGGPPAGRVITRRPQYYFQNFMRAVRDNLPFTQVLLAKTNSQGIVIFPDGNQLVPCPADRTHCKTPTRETEVFIMPEWVERSTVTFVLPATGGACLEEFDFDPAANLFFYEEKDVRVYLTSLVPRDNAFEAQIPSYNMRFGGRGRYAGETFAASIKNGELAALQPHVSRWGDNTRWKIIGEEAGSRVVNVGTPSLNKIAAVGLSPQVRISKDSSAGRERHYFYFGRDEYYWLSHEMIKKYGLKEGDVMEVESLAGQVCALIDRRGEAPVRIPFVLDWRWDGDQFILDYTTASDVVAKRMTGYRVLEQTATCSNTSGQLLGAGGKTHMIIGTMPGKTAPVPVSALVADNQEVLFFVDQPRLAKKDWQAVELLVRAREGALKTARKPDEASAKAKEAEELKKLRKQTCLN